MEMLIGKNLDFFNLSTFISIYSIYEMSFKFLFGFITGIYLGTKYDFKPHVKFTEDKIREFHKELEEKHNQLRTEEVKKQDPPADASFFGSWFKNKSS